MKPMRAARGHRAGRERVVVLEALHLGQRDAPHGDRGGGGRAAQRGEERAGDDRRRGQSAADMADPGIGGVVEIAAHAGGAGDVAHQHEHRNDGELIEARDREGFRAERGQRVGPAADRHRAEEADGEHRQADRHPQDEQREQRDDAGEADLGVGHSGLPMARLSSTSRGTWPRRASTNDFDDQHGRIEADADGERLVDRLERDVQKLRAFAETARGRSGDEQPPRPDRRDAGGQRLDAEARNPFERGTDHGGDHVGGDMRAGAPAIADRAGHREHQQHDRKIERAVERRVEHVAAGHVHDDDRHQDGQHRAAAIERDGADDLVDEREHDGHVTVRPSLVDRVVHRPGVLDAVLLEIGQRLLDDRLGGVEHGLAHGRAEAGSPPPSCCRSPS